MVFLCLIFQKWEVYGGPFGDALLIIRDQNYGTNEETGVTVSNASDAMKLAAEQIRNAIAGG